MRGDDKIEWVLPAVPQAQLDEAAEKAKALQNERFMAKVQHEYDDFRAMRQYVIEHLPYLQGKTVPVEITSIQLLETHECLILNNLILVPFGEAREMIATLKRKDKDNDKTTNG